MRRRCVWVAGFGVWGVGFWVESYGFVVSGWCVCPLQRNNSAIPLQGTPIRRDASDGKLVGTFTLTAGNAQTSTRTHFNTTASALGSSPLPPLAATCTAAALCFVTRSATGWQLAPLAAVSADTSYLPLVPRIELMLLQVAARVLVMRVHA